MNEWINYDSNRREKKRKKERKKERGDAPRPVCLLIGSSGGGSGSVGGVGARDAANATTAGQWTQSAPRPFLSPPSSPFSCMGYRPLILCFVFFFLFSIWKETYLISLLAAKSWAMETLVIVADNNRLTFRQISIQFSPNSKHFRSVSTKANIQVY